MRKISFNLEKWLKDKSRKVVTRDGRSVRIICIDRKGKSGNIVGLVGEDESLIYVWNNNGIHIVSCMEENDLFFADEEEKTIDDTEINSLAYLTELGYTCIPPKKEEELTEFEKAIRNILVRYISNVDDFPATIKNEAKSLLDLARKELEPKLDKKTQRGL